MEMVKRINDLLENPLKFSGDDLSQKEITIYTILEGSTDMCSRVTFITDNGIVEGTWYSTKGETHYAKYIYLVDVTVSISSGQQARLDNIILYMDHIVAFSIPNN